jgi:tetratricopeptide (TPR) repeat protein
MVMLLDIARDEMSGQPGYRYWTASYLTLAGMQDFNEGNVSSADRNFRRAIQAVPFDGLAWYGRALVQNRLGDHARAAHYLGNVLKVQEQVNFTRLTLRAQLILMQSWDQFQKGDLEAAHRLYSLSLTPEAWE